MLAENLRFHRSGMDLEDGCEVRLEAQAVEPGAGAEDAVVLREDPREVRQRIGRMGDHEEHGFWRRREDSRKQLALEVGVLVQEPQTSCWIIPIVLSSGVLVHARGA